MRRLLAAAALVALAASPLVAQHSPSIGVYLDLGASGDTIPGAETPFWINAAGVLTRYDGDLGERLSVSPVPYDFSRSGTLISDVVLKYFHGLDGDTTVAMDPGDTAQEGVYMVHDGLLRGFYSHQVGSVGVASSCTLNVHVAAADQETERVNMTLIDDVTGPRKTWPDSTIKVYKNERVNVRWRGTNSQNVSVQVNFFYRDSTGAVVP